MVKKMLLVATAMSVVGATMLVSGPASADAGTETHVDSASATVGSSTISISGNATFVDAPVIVGEDGTGDATIPGIGTDINVATISRPVGSNNLVFKWTIGDQMAAPLIATPAAAFIWPVMGNDNDQSQFLMAGRAGGFPPTAGTPGHSLMANGADGFSTVARLTGTFGNGEVSWNLPLTRLFPSNAAAVGGRVQMGSGGGAPPGTILGAWEIVYGILLMDDFFAEEYIVPGATIEAGVAVAGTDVETIALSKLNTVNPTTGAFSGSIAKPATRGEHVLVVKACYRPEICDIETKTITI